MSWDVGDPDPRDQLTHTLLAEYLYRSFSWSGSSSALDERPTVRGASRRYTNPNIPASGLVSPTTRTTI